MCAILSRVYTLLISPDLTIKLQKICSLRTRTLSTFYSTLTLFVRLIDRPLYTREYRRPRMFACPLNRPPRPFPPGTCQTVVPCAQFKCPARTHLERPTATIRRPAGTLVIGGGVAARKYLAVTRLLVCTYWLVSVRTYGGVVVFVCDHEVRIDRWMDKRKACECVSSLISKPGWSHRSKVAPFIIYT